jgi:uncharacterized protein YyaL (SSP411 family)
MTSTNKNANHLATESSPYLLQHQYNPVDWYPWGPEALEKAKSEDKPILVSIGYSACHWCHVMERESFESEALAKLMNDNYVCIKVDREERPDIDQIYMDAVQAMGVNGGWPLNVFITPDQKPFYGGTYFPPQSWQQVLVNVHNAFKTKRSAIDESAEQFSSAINRSEIEKYGLNDTNGNFNKEDVELIFKKLALNFDQTSGGMNRAPKFPMPSIWHFLLRYYFDTNNKDAEYQILLTLNEMCRGGLYDQVKGGFARYSVDAEWFAPHFEKMLYDNGQLVSLYADAFKITQRSEYKEVLIQTNNWLKDELTDANGAFYAALDADSEGVEGKYYTWTDDEIKTLGFEEQELINKYYNISREGNWEEGRSILHRKKGDKEFAKENEIKLEEWETIKVNFMAAANSARSLRVRPGLDDKVLAGWNGLMLKGLVDAYNAIGDETILTCALQNANFLSKHLIVEGTLKRTFKNGIAKIEGYLEDYAFVADALLALYQATFDEKWLSEASALLDTAIARFYDSEEGFFYYTSSESEALIARKKEIFDNVIPASNSGIAHALYKAGIILDRQDYSEIASAMVIKMKKLIITEPQYLSHWAQLLADFSSTSVEIAIAGPECHEYRAAIAANYLPNTVIIGTNSISDLPLLEGRKAIDGKTTIYVCFEKTCKLPVFTVSEALAQIP